MLPPLLHAPTSTDGLCIAGLQCLNLLAGVNEIASPTPYSKFAADDKAKSAGMIPSKLGMLGIYVPPAAAAAAALAIDVGSAGNGRETIVAGLLLTHFGKRVAEVLCIHRYSGSMASGTAGFIGTFYSLIVVLVAWQQRAVPASLYVGADPVLGVALALFAIGQAGNLYHHWLLSTMRRPTSGSAASPSGVSTYQIPTGGLFPLVTMPHYLFEIIAWLGIALATQQLNAVLVSGGMASYLTGRSVATTRWYKEKFGKAWPESRKNLIPFVF